MTETHKEFEYRTGHKILEQYGMTETNMITSNPYIGERKAGTVGIVLEDVEIRIADLEIEDEVKKNGDIGVVEVKALMYSKGYWKTEKTKVNLETTLFYYW